MPILDDVLRPAPIVVIVEVYGVAENGVMRIYPTLEQVQNALQIAALQAAQNPNAPIIIQFQASNLTLSIHELILVLEDSMLLAMANTSNVSICLYAGHLGALTVHEPQVVRLSALNGDVIELSVARHGNVAQIRVEVDGNNFSLPNLRITLPNMGSGNVPELTNLNGVTDIIRKSIVENGTVYAIINSPGDITLTQVNVVFDDVTQGQWFYRAVDFVTCRNLFIGVGEREFSPNSDMTRAMMTNVLYNLSDDVAPHAAPSFNDVVIGQWYADAIAWAYRVNIVHGYGNGNFGPSDSITREQMAVILMRYANYFGISTVERGNIAAFRDGNEVSDWAIDAMRWAVGAGLIIGHDNALSPRNHATRAEIAQLYARFIEYLVRTI